MSLWNLSGYRRLGGPKTSPADLQAIIDGLGQNGLLRPDRLLTGYIPNAESLNVVASLVAKLRKSNPGIIYVLDRE
jgi:pyridoxine kinase